MGVLAKALIHVAAVLLWQPTDSHYPSRCFPIVVVVVIGGVVAAVVAAIVVSVPLPFLETTQITRSFHGIRNDFAVEVP